MNSLRKMKIGLMRLGMRTVGRLSNGINIAFRDGFTSGVMLEYIYRNQPAGRLLLGKWIDRTYLSHPGWQVIRTRKDNLEALLRRAVAEQRKAGRSPLLLDVASGPARYMLDVLAGEGMKDAKAVCRDLDEDALEFGRCNAEKLGLSERVTYTSGDALSAESLAKVAPKPNIVVSSGFYDWITDDELVKKSMSLLFDLLPQGGCFVFTNQTGHIDIEMVQAVFVDFHKEPLRMVVRDADQTNGWAQAAGFNVLDTRADSQGHYSVTLASRP
jgi:SAM-dependent methyltransferase